MTLAKWFNEPGLADELMTALASGILTVSTDYEDVRQADIIVIAVGTPVDANRAIVTEHLEAVSAVVAPLLRAGHLVILKSTVAPGTTAPLESVTTPPMLPL